MSGFIVFLFGSEDGLNTESSKDIVIIFFGFVSPMIERDFCNWEEEEEEEECEEDKEEFKEERWEEWEEEGVCEERVKSECTSLSSCPRVG